MTTLGATSSAANIGVIFGQPTGTLSRSYVFTSTVESWTTTAGTLSSASGKLNLTHSAAAVALEPVGASNIADGELVLDMYYTTLAAGKSVGIIFRATDASNHYLWIVGSSTGNQIELFKCVAGVYTSLGIGPTPMRPAALGSMEGRFMIRFNGSLLSLYLDGTLLSKVIDTTYTTGRVGMRVDGATIDIDNVKLYSTPDLTSGNAIAP